MAAAGGLGAGHAAAVSARLVRRGEVTCSCSYCRLSPAVLCQEGGCGQASSSTAEILGSLGRAVTGYIPIVSMLGDQVNTQSDTLYT